MKRTLTIAAALWAGAAWACTDFSGKWKGTCRDEGQPQTTAAEIEIQQSGCQAITIDGTAMTIGTPLQSTRTESGVTETTTRTQQWDSPQAVLTETTKVLAQQGGRTVFELDGTTQLSLQGGKLLSATSETARESGTTGQPTTTTRKSSCTFDKQ